MMAHVYGAATSPAAADRALFARAGYDEDDDTPTIPRNAAFGGDRWGTGHNTTTFGDDPRGTGNNAAASQGDASKDNRFAKSPQDDVNGDQRTFRTKQAEMSKIYPVQQEQQGSREDYIEQLAQYGVYIMDDNDLTVPLGEGTIGSVVNSGLEQFTSEQLRIILEGVQATGVKLAATLATLGYDVTPAEAFQLVFGAVEFGLDEDRMGTGLTIPTGDDATRPENTIYILLDDHSFDNSIDGGIEFGDLPGAFVVVHELGHAFVNRSGMPAIDTTDFVRATQSFWNPNRGNLSLVISARVAEDYELLPDPNTPGNFLLPSGYYIPRGFLTANQGEVRTFFPNESGRFSSASPDEGFADSFSHFVIDFNILQSYSEPRYQYFEGNFELWIAQMVALRETNTDE
jgi:hypothetical protein